MISGAKLDFTSANASWCFIYCNRNSCNIYRFIHKS